MARFGDQSNRENVFVVYLISAKLIVNGRGMKSAVIVGAKYCLSLQVYWKYLPSITWICDHARLLKFGVSGVQPEIGKT